MLKIAEYNTITGKKVELSELDKYGFKKKYHFEPSCICRDDDECQIYFELKSRKFCFCNYGYDILYDLIKDGLVEKVEE